MGQDEVLQLIDEQVRNHGVLLYMKGSPDQPQCGFSAQVVQILAGYGKEFSYVDVLAHPEIRATLPRYANWPTFPQLWVKGELVGGCDIVVEMDAEGELEALILEAA